LEQTIGYTKHIPSTFFIEQLCDLCSRFTIGLCVLLYEEKVPAAIKPLKNTRHTLQVAGMNTKEF